MACSECVVLYISYGVCEGKCTKSSTKSNVKQHVLVKYVVDF